MAWPWKRTSACVKPSRSPAATRSWAATRSMPVAQHLHLDVARADEELLEVDAAVGEGRLGLAGGGGEGAVELVGAADGAHALAAASRGGLHQDGEAEGLGLAVGRGGIRRGHL